MEISKAYQVLSDEQQRLTYDKQRLISDKQQFQSYDLQLDDVSSLALVVPPRLNRVFYVSLLFSALKS